MKSHRCIYCGKEFDPCRGEGDHALFAALGEFKDDVRFRGQCPSCNNRIGRFEQQVVQSGPEGFYRQIVCPASARLNKRRIGRQRGALGAPGPVYTAKLGDHSVLVEPSRENPRDVNAVDQIVIWGEDGQDHRLRLYAGMSAAQLRDRIAKVGVGEIKSFRLHCDEPHASHYLNLLKSLFPKLRLEEEAVTEAGSWPIQGRAAFSVMEPYFQGLAKIAFHYYLCHSRRGFRGDEAMFDEVRRFILMGGDVSRSCKFTQGRFRPPFGELPSGGVLSSRDWCHLLAADESADSVVVYLHLFVGPGCLRTPCYVTLGKLTSGLLVPDSVWGHAYVYDSPQTKSRYCGRVVPATISYLCA